MVRHATWAETGGTALHMWAPPESTAGERAEIERFVERMASLNTDARGVIVLPEGWALSRTRSPA